MDKLVKELNEFIDKYGTTDKRTVEKSQELDRWMNEHGGVLKKGMSR